MIPRAYITEWQKNAPWRSNAQVEQDLIRPEVEFNMDEAYDLVKKELIDKI